MDTNFIPFKSELLFRDLDYSLNVINFFEKPKEKIFKLAQLPNETLLYRVLPRLLLEIVRKYLRVEVEGTEHIPTSGAALIVPNHSGFSGFDAVVLGHEIHRATNRVPKVLTHALWFITKATAIPAQKMGFIEATTKNGKKYLDKKDLVVLFPEGEHGNFKSSTDRYTLQEFKRGFVRMALEKQVTIVPVIVLGAEETHINLKKLKFTKFLRGIVLPIPLNIIPLPAKWKIKFLPPIQLPYKPSAANRSDLVHDIAQEIREKMQLSLHEELRKRDYIYIKGVY